MPLALDASGNGTRTMAAKRPGLTCAIRKESRSVPTAGRMMFDT